jgi:dTDP-4-amino-4,6-dideoxygalactose transaminase
MAEENIPLVDLRGAAADPELREAVERVMGSTRFVLGPEVASFEQAFAAYCGTRYAVGVGSGTAALHLALHSLGIGRGDRVVTVAHTFHATVEAIHQTGADVTLVDVDDETGGMDPDALNAAIAGSAAVVPVHLYGQPVDMRAVLAAAQLAGAAVLEDAAQAHGASALVDAQDDPRRVGSLGTIAAFSFYPGKNLGAFGDGGAVTTDVASLGERVERLRDHGRISKYLYAEPGFCERLDTIQAAVLELKLRKLDGANFVRRELADRYRAELHGVGDLRLPASVPDRPSVYHLFVIRIAHRDALLEHLQRNGVQAGIHYAVPIHLQPAWEHLGYRQGAFPVSEAWARECLSLPIYPELTEAQLSRVVAEVRRFFSGPRSRY